MALSRGGGRRKWVRKVRQHRTPVPAVELRTVSGPGFGGVCLELSGRVHAVPGWRQAEAICREHSGAACPEGGWGNSSHQRGREATPLGFSQA